MFTKLTGEGYTVYRKSAFRNKILRVLDTLFFVLFRSSKYDVIIIQMFSNMAFLVDFFVVNLARWMNKKTITVIRGGAFVEFYEKHPQLVSGVLKKCTIVSSPSKFIGNFLNSKGISTIRVPNFIEINKFPYSWKDKADDKLLWVRAFNDIYKPELAIQTVNKLKDQYKNIHLTMVGPDQGKRDHCIQLIRDLNLQDHITLTGPVSNDRLTEYYSTHNIYLNTTNYESFGVAVVEAACSGIPIVSTNVGELPFMWENKQDMFLADNHNEDAFIGGVKELLEDKDLRMKFSINARRKAEEYSWENVRTQWNNLLVNG
ncbi:MAG: glycosyltransferase family 4 protein [Flavobacteriales bacterium]|nr:glycosyltransferase family 4 protein [Flavobacteriales bacterium]